MMTLFLAASVCLINDPQFDWMDPLIERNFKSFEKGISLKAIEKTQDSHEWLVRLKVIDNHVYAVKGEKGAAYRMLEYLAATYGLPDLDLLYYQQDGLTSYIQGDAPIFCSSKKKWVDQGLYFIDWYTSMPNPKWNQIVECINQSIVPWEERENKVVWRGTSTDAFYTPKNWMEDGRRGTLCYLSALHEDKIDARFIGVSPYRCDDPFALTAVLPMGSELTYAEQLRYKYQIILDGICTTYPGDRWRLLSHSVVFMHESEFGHWFYEALIPWVHYVPLKSNLSDLLEKLDYLAEHDDEARALADNARAFALNFLMSEQMAVYCYKALIKYASLQKFTPILSWSYRRLDSRHESAPSREPAHAPVFFKSSS